jgi:hypothetical protein
MSNMREYWAREAEMMRDKSAVLENNATKSKGISINDVIRFIDINNNGISSWYKETRDKYEYLGATYEEDGAKYATDGTIFFADIVKGIKKMVTNTLKDGKPNKEQAGYFVEGGLIVGNDAKSTSMQSTDAMTDLISKRNSSKVPIKAQSGGKEYAILAPIHTHPSEKGWYNGPSGEDTAAIEQLSPTKAGFVFGTNDYFYPYCKTGFVKQIKEEFYENVKKYGEYTINFYVKQIVK